MINFQIDVLYVHNFVYNMDFFITLSSAIAIPVYPH